MDVILIYRKVVTAHVVLAFSPFLFNFFFNLSIKQGLCKSKLRKKNIHALAKLNKYNCDGRTPVAQAIKHFRVQEFSPTNEHTLY